MVFVGEGGVGPCLAHVVNTLLQLFSTFTMDILLYMYTVTGTKYQ